MEPPEPLIPASALVDYSSVAFSIIMTLRILEIPSLSRTHSCISSDAENQEKWRGQGVVRFFRVLNLMSGSCLVFAVSEIRGLGLAELYVASLGDWKSKLYSEFSPHALPSKSIVTWTEIMVFPDGVFSENRCVYLVPHDTDLGTWLPPLLRSPFLQLASEIKPLTVILLPELVTCGEAVTFKSSPWDSRAAAEYNSWDS